MIAVAIVVVVALEVVAAGVALYAVSRVGRFETRLNGRLDRLEQEGHRQLTQVQGIRDDSFGNLKDILGEIGRISKQIDRFEDDALALQRTLKEARNVFQEPRLDRALLARILERLEELERRASGG